MRCIKRAMRWYMTKQILMRWAKTARTAKGSSGFLDLTSQCASHNDERKIEQAAQSRARNAKTITSMLKAQSSKKVKESLNQTIEDGSKLVLNKWEKANTNSRYLLSNDFVTAEKCGKRRGRGGLSAFFRIFPL